MPCYRATDLVAHAHQPAYTVAMARCHAVHDVGGHGSRGQRGPGPKEPAARKAVEDGEGSVSAGDDVSRRFVDHMDCVVQMTLSRQLLEHRPAGRRRQAERHELETVHAVPAPQLADGLPADTAVAVVEDGEGADADDEVIVAD